VTKGTYLYTIGADCNAALAGLTILGMFNIYKSYWSFTLAAGAATYTTTSGSLSVAYTYNVCNHQHMYNWMAQP